MDSKENQPLITHSISVNAFLLALDLIDGKITQKQEEKLQTSTKDFRPASIGLFGDTIRTHKLIHDAYLTLFEEGTKDVLVHLINKCGSMLYLAKILSHYISGSLEWQENHSEFVVCENYLNMVCYDDEYRNELKALNIGLLNIISMVYPENNIEKIKFAQVDIIPLHGSSDIDEFEMVFRFKNTNRHYGYESQIKFVIKFADLRKGVIVQAIQCFNNIVKYNEEGSFCRFKVIGNYRVCYSMEFALKDYRKI